MEVILKLIISQRLHRTSKETKRFKLKQSRYLPYWFREIIYSTSFRVIFPRDVFNFHYLSSSHHALVSSFCTVSSLYSPSWDFHFFAIIPFGWSFLFSSVKLYSVFVFLLPTCIIHQFISSLWTCFSSCSLL